MSGNDGVMILRKTTDANFEHCAKTLVPFCIETIRGIKASDIEINPEFGVSSWDFLNAVQIAAEVALAFSHEQYGKPRIPVTATYAPLPQSHEGT
jgi:hypothetical protein